MGCGPLDVVEELQQTYERIGKAISPTVPFIDEGGRRGRDRWEEEESTPPVAMGLQVYMHVCLTGSQ